MSARHSAPERIVTPRLKMADWCGTITPVDRAAKTQICDMSGSLICAATGWRLAVTAALDQGTIYLTARFDALVAADDAAPWTIEHEIGKAHQYQPAGYDRLWTGSMPQSGKQWVGTLADRYGHTLKVVGKRQIGGVISLRAAVSLNEVRQ